MRTIMRGSGPLALAGALAAVLVLTIAASAAALAPPEFVECVKTHDVGAFTDKACTQASPTHTGKYETRTASPGKAVSFTTDEASFVLYGIDTEVTCKKGKAAGEVVGAQQLASVVFTFSACTALGGAKCKTPGAESSKAIRTAPLEGTLGVIDSATNTFGLELAAPTGTLFTAITCGEENLVFLRGAVLARFEASAPFAGQARFFFEAGEGPEEYRFEGGPRIELEEFKHEEEAGDAFLSARGTMNFKKLMIEP